MSNLLLSAKAAFLDHLRKRSILDGTHESVDYRRFDLPDDEMKVLEEWLADMVEVHRTMLRNYPPRKRAEW